jgi:hypothetical protein
VINEKKESIASTQPKEPNTPPPEGLGGQKKKIDMGQEPRHLCGSPDPCCKCLNWDESETTEAQIKRSKNNLNQ